VICVLLQCRLAACIWWLAVVFTVISGIDYVKRGFGILYALDNRRINS
jgi:hypothetical protein